MIYLGTLGRMVELKCPSQQQLDMGDRFSFEPTLEGRIKGQAQPIQRRTWSISTSDATTPMQQAAILSFVHGEWGVGPFVFISTDALVTNLLTPSAAACQDFGPVTTNIQAGGPVEVSPGDWAGASVRSYAPESVGDGQEIYMGLDYVPVLPGQVVTGSAWLRGVDARMRLYFYGEGGGVPIGTQSSFYAGTSQWQRISVSAQPPAGAVSCRLVAWGVDQVTRPAITWTDSMFDWAAGEGCPKAVIHAASKNLVMASRDPRGGRYANLSYTITEVG